MCELIFLFLFFEWFDFLFYLDDLFDFFFYLILQCFNQLMIQFLYVKNQNLLLIISIEICIIIYLFKFVFIKFLTYLN